MTITKTFKKLTFSLSILLSLGLPNLPENEARATQSNRFRFDGEYGLWVELRGDQMDVHWLTAKKDSGFLQVLNDDQILQEFRTPLAQAHRATFASENQHPLRIRYGSLTSPSDRHETILYLRDEVPRTVFDQVDSVFVLGDLHGEFENLTQLLMQAKLIDSDLHWRGGRRHLVALGDLFDRGHNVTRLLWFFYRLEREAARAGGKVHIVLGNHEIMTFCHDLRYLSGKEKLMAQLHGANYGDLYNVRHSLLGRWLASKPGIIRINDVLMAHGGIDPVYTAATIDAVNDSLRAFLQEDVFQYLLRDSLATAPIDSTKYYKRLGFFFADNTVFWHRSYVQSDTLNSELDHVLDKFKSRVHVVAHTPVPTITELYDGKVIAVDLIRPATEILLLVGKETKKMKRFKINLDGELIPLETS